jgi:hypothetical protein
MPNTCSIARPTRDACGGRGQRSLGGTSYSSQIASQTFRTGTPASIASTALRPPRTAKTWSRATLWARMDPKWRSSRDQNSCRRTTPTLTRRCGAYRGGMVPGTGSDTLDVVLQIGIALAMLVLLVLLIRNYRGR